MKQCSYCGRDNADEAVNCRECGTSFLETDAPAKKKKSKALAVILALIFGPLGLLYLGGEGLMIFLFVGGIGLFAFPLLVHAKMGALVRVLVRIACAFYAANAVDRRNETKSESAEAEEILLEAARLENKDMTQAIAKYEELVEKFPESRAAQEAKRNLQTIRK